MKAGKHVISAVPAGLSEEQLVEILETVRKTGMKYMMAETSYYRPKLSPAVNGPGKVSSEPSSTPKPSTITRASFP